MKEVTKEVYLKWYEDMLLWRKFEDKLAALYIQQKIRGLQQQELKFIDFQIQLIRLALIRLKKQKVLLKKKKKN